MIPKIRFVVDVVSKPKDRSGNTYSFAIITSTITGKKLVVRDGDLSGCIEYVRKVCGANVFSDIGLYVERTIPAQNWNIMEISFQYKGCPWFHSLTDIDIENLEK